MNACGRLFPIAIFVLAAVRLTAGSDAWPQWRGPDRSGIIPAAAAPANWPATLGQGVVRDRRRGILVTRRR